MRELDTEGRGVGRGRSHGLKYLCTFPLEDLREKRLLKGVPSAGRDRFI